jgi:hypothetical protein
MKKRILVLLSVVALMVVMLAMSVAPAFAGAKLWTCVDPTRQDPEVYTDLTKFEKERFEARGYVCTKQGKIKPL